jgi:hypothetical protein
METCPPQRRPGFVLSRYVMLCALLTVAAGLAVVSLFDPAKHSFYPYCLFHRLTGLNCPGCGGLRALHQLLHGHVAAAFQFNALVVLCLPLAAWFGVRRLWRLASGKAQPPFVVRPAWLWLGLAVIVAFGVLRNLPLAAFAITIDSPRTAFSRSA